jgi:tyrosine-protein kinase Etk/Wzc
MQDSKSTDTSDSVTSRQNADNLSFIDLMIALGQQRILFLRICLVGAVLSILVAFMVPRYYSATTLLLPPQQQGSANANALAQLSALGGLAGVGAVKTPDEMYVALLKSRSIQDGLIQRLNLLARYEVTSVEMARKILTDRTSVVGDKKSGFIKLTVDDVDAKFSASLANAYVPELQKLLTRLALTDAQQRRVFFEQQVNKTKNSLNEAEVKFRISQAASGLVVTQALAEAGVKESAALRGQIAALEVQLQTLTRFATEEHPDVQRVSAELSAMRRQLSSIEQGSGRKSNTKLHGTTAVQLYRDMKVQEVLLEALIKQLEMARADEAKEGPLLQQVDQAVVPEKQSKPTRWLIIMAGSIIGVFVALFVCLARQLTLFNTDEWSQIKKAWLGMK